MQGQIAVQESRVTRLRYQPQSNIEYTEQEAQVSREVYEACKFYLEELVQRAVYSDYYGVIFFTTRERANEALRRITLRFEEQSIQHPELKNFIKVNHKRQRITAKSGARTDFKVYPSRGREVDNFAGVEISSVAFSKEAYYQTVDLSKQYLMTRLRSRCVSPRLTVF